MGRHSQQLPADGIHGPVAFVYANSTARLADSGFDATFDIYKVGVDTDTGLLYYISAIDGGGNATWVPFAGTSPIIFGTNYQYVEDASFSSTSSGTFQTKLTLTTSNLPSGDFLVQWAALLSNQRDVGEIRLYDSTGAQTIDSSYFEIRNINQPWLYSGFQQVTTSGVRTYQLQWRDQPGGDTQNIQNARISIWRVA